MSTKAEELLAKLQSRQGEIVGEIAAKEEAQDALRAQFSQLKAEKAALVSEQERLGTRIMAARQAVTAGIGTGTLVSVQRQAQPLPA